LSFIPESIKDLAQLVALPSQTSTSTSRPFKRIATAPAVMHHSSERVDMRMFDRGKSAKVLPIKPGRLKNEIQLYLQNNRIACIPPELCKLQNLVVLSLSEFPLTPIFILINKS
jgi:Leucine-rich repeat (LRR) protein